jgi:hypothetical protein
MKMRRESIYNKWIQMSDDYQAKLIRDDRKWAFLLLAYIRVKLNKRFSKFQILWRGYIKKKKLRIQSDIRNQKYLQQFQAIENINK